MDTRRVVITGLGAISPIGLGREEFWKNCIAGHSSGKALSTLSSCDLFKKVPDGQFASQVVTEVDNDQFAQILRTLPAQVRSRDRYIQFAVAAAFQAVQDAHITVTDRELSRFGTALATACGAAQTTEKTYYYASERGKNQVDPDLIPEDFYLDCMYNAPEVLLANFFQLHGPCATLSTACASGIDVIAHAYELIKGNKADIMLTGASEAPLSPVRFGGCDVIGCLATDHNSDPPRASRPFDAKRSGFVMGEGAGMLLLEEREHALRRNARIYGELVGIGLSSNALHMISLKRAIPHMVRAIRLALQDANLQPTDIDYISAHASSTFQNDQSETEAFKNALGAHAYRVPISGLKSLVGHQLGAAGVLSTIATCLGMYYGKIHPTINYEKPDSECDLDYVPNHARDFSGRHALVLASGFSGVHACLVYQKY